MVKINKLQTIVLRELSHHPSRRFSEMMAVTELTSDDFKFHLRKLVKLGLVFKNDDGVYELTAEGKELANRFDYEKLAPIRQPKLTTVTYLRRHNPETDQTEYLFQRRLRQPFFHYWGVIGEPIRWGEPFIDAAARGLSEQTGLNAPLSLKGFYRQRDIDKESGTILEDKLFVVFVAEWQGEEPDNWPYADSQWMSQTQFSSKEARFDSCVAMIEIVQRDDMEIDDNTTTYQPELY